MTYEINENSTLNLEFIRERRLEKGLTLQDMAESFGFKTATNYQKYEQGKYSFDANMLPVLSEKLDCKIEIFFAPKVAKTETEWIYISILHPYS